MINRNHKMDFNIIRLYLIIINIMEGKILPYFHYHVLNMYMFIHSNNNHNNQIFYFIMIILLVQINIDIQIIIYFNNINFIKIMQNPYN